MRVLLGLGNVKLALAPAGDRLGQGGLGGMRGERHRVGPAMAILGQGRDRELLRAGPGELVEAGLAERADQLAGTIGPEVEVEHRVAVGGAIVVADHRGANELVGLAPLVGALDGLDGARGARGPSACTIAS